MPRPTRPASSAALLAAALLAACTAAPSPAPAPTPSAASPARRVGAPPAATAADARFIEHMLAHHAQALEMTALVPARTRRADIRLLAERIAVSQRDEIATMRRWLAARGGAAPGAAPTAAAAAAAPHDGAHAPAHHAAAGGHDVMPGMLTAAQLAGLARASGPAFDQLFLASMIRHHEGAVTMVAELFAAPGAAQDPELFGLASDVDADQRAEIARMRRVQRAAPPDE